MALRYVIFIGLFATLTALLHVYLYRRLIRDTTTRKGLRTAGKAVIVGLWAVLVLGRPIGDAIDPAVTQALGTGTWVWVGIAVYLWLTLAAAGLTLLALRL